MYKIISELYKPAKRHIKKLLINKEYRDLYYLETRLHKAMRFKETEIRIHGWKLSIPDPASFISTFHEIFVERIYDFQFNNESPSIIDLGANIGLSILFFKTIYPKAKIVAFEADPIIFKHLVKNVHGNGFTDVELINAAAWDHETELDFYSEGGDGGHIATGLLNTKSVKVPAIDIGKFLCNRTFDFLKIDIEGAEEQVVPACKGLLSRISYIFIEYHSYKNKRQCLDMLIAMLASEGFRINIQNIGQISSPFIKRSGANCFDMQLNIFGSKDL